MQQRYSLRIVYASEIVKRANKKFKTDLGNREYRVLLLYKMAGRPLRDSTLNYAQLAANLTGIIRIQYQLARAGLIEKTNQDQPRPPYQITARGLAYIDYYELTARRFRPPQAMQAIINGLDNPRRPK